MMLIPRLEKLWSTSWTWRNYKWMTDFETGFNRKELKTYKDWVGSESWSFGFQDRGAALGFASQALQGRKRGNPSRAVQTHGLDMRY
jgi:hypothetical protein